MRLRGKHATQRQQALKDDIEKQKSTSTTSAAASAAAAAAMGVAAVVAQQKIMRQNAARLRHEAEQLEKQLMSDHEATLRSHFRLFQTLAGSSESGVVSAEQLAFGAKDIWSVQISRDECEKLVEEYD